MSTQLEIPVETGLPRASCVAVLETLIFNLPALAVGPVAVWEGKPDAVIFITGRIRLNGYFHDSAARWTCAAYGAKGLFGKGYVAMKPDRLALLPFVK